jgi:hypothetical protein
VKEAMMKKPWLLLGALSALAASASVEVLRPCSAEAFYRRVSAAYCKPLGTEFSQLQTNGSVRAGLHPKSWPHNWPTPGPRTHGNRLLCPVPHDSLLPLSSVGTLHVDVTRASSSGTFYAKACRTHYSESGGLWASCGTEDEAGGTGFSRIRPKLDNWDTNAGMPYVLIRVGNDQDYVRGIYLEEVAPSDGVDPVL